MSAHLVKQLDLGIVELSGKIHIDLMRIDETLRFIPKGILAAFTIFEYRNEQFS